MTGDRPEYDPNPAGGTVRSMLRLATADSHDRVDALFSRATLEDRAGYGRFLLALASAQLPVEAALSQAGVERIIPDWPQRQRADLLRADLAALGLAAPVPQSGIAFDRPEAALGGVYVLEGSRLGARLLIRRVPPQLPTSFLGASDPAAWQRLMALLEERLSADDKREAAVAGALAVFDAFEAAAHALNS